MTAPQNLLESGYQSLIDLISPAEYLRAKNGMLIFSGTAETPDLSVEILPQENNSFYYAVTVGEEAISFESADFPSAEECRQAVADFAGQFIGKTIRFTRIQKRFSYIYESYEQLDETTGEWKIISEELLDRFALKCFLWKNSRTQWERSFHL